MMMKEIEVGVDQELWKTTFKAGSGLTDGCGLA